MTEINPPKTNNTMEVVEAPAPVPSRTILVATDFSDASGDAVKWVLDNLVKENLPEDKQHVYIYSSLGEPLIVDPDMIPFTDVEDEETKRSIFLDTQSALVTLLEQAKLHLESTAKRCQISGSLEFSASPGEAIVEKAREMKPDMVVVGSHGKGSIRGLLLGSVSSHVLTHWEGEVVIVRGARKH